MRDKLEAVLAGFQPPEWPLDLAASGFIELVLEEPDALRIRLRLPFAGQHWTEQLQRQLSEPLKRVSGKSHIHWEVLVDVATLAHASQSLAPIPGVRNILAVTSGKGGVGKSTTAVNLALALRAEGARVGILDADIYGPSIPLMLGCAGRQLESPDGKLMLPVPAQGIVCNSIGFLVPEAEAAIWRGPMASKALTQLLHETQWGELDYLVVDLPPGTGDIQLTLAQQVPTTAAIIVTTPQDVALIDARKGIAMFEKVAIPVLGVVENMSYHVCSRCGHHETIFGTGGGEKVARQYGIRLLGQLPLHIRIREDLDKGTPTVVSAAGGELAAAYQQLARGVAAALYFSGRRVPSTIFTRPNA